MLTRRTLLAAAPAALLIPAAAQAANPPYYQEGGVAIDGTDPTSYFTEGRPVAGDPDLTLHWQGATWRFATVGARDQFERMPRSYAPAFGGYCAWAVSQGYIAPTVPEAWKIVDGTLYLNFSRRIQRRWERDIAGHIAQGKANWPAVLTA
ncbi:MAG: YHS domain-containing (seleno)protein [Pseudomonadota bacterium]